LIRLAYHRLIKIRSFHNKETERIWLGLHSRKLPGDVQNRALRKLRQLDASLTLEDLRNPPGNQLEPLKADRAGQWSIRINDQWRICFRWSKGEAHDVEIIDYH
jgi:proteic killer suppression protein